MSRKTGKNEKGQGMFEFSLLLPVLLALVFGIVEIGRLLFIYVGVTNATREGARYGVTIGLASDGVTPRYRHCDDMRDAALNLGNLVGMSQGDILVEYDDGTISATSTPAPYATCSVGAFGPVDIELGDRLIVKASANYSPLVPIPVLPSFQLSSVTARTIIAKLPAGTASPYPTNPPFSPTPSHTPTPSQTPTTTQTPSNTPSSTPSETPSTTPTPNICLNIHFSDLIYDDASNELSFLITNLNASNIQITGLEHNWPAGNGSLLGIRSGETNIFDEVVAAGPMSIPGTHSWKIDNDPARNISNSERLTLKYSFEVARSPYSLVLEFNNTCTKTAGIIENTPTPTLTNTPSATPSQTPSVTPSPTLVLATSTPTFTATANACSNINLGNVQIDNGNKTYQFTISNNSGASILLFGLIHEWPSGGANGSLKEIKIRRGGDEQQIYDTEDPNSPLNVPAENNWKSGTSGFRTINNGQNAILIFLYNAGAASSGYSSTLTFDNGCVISIPAASATAIPVPTATPIPNTCSIAFDPAFATGSEVVWNIQNNEGVPLLISFVNLPTWPDIPSSQFISAMRVDGVRFWDDTEASPPSLITGAWAADDTIRQWNVGQTRMLTINFGTTLASGSISIVVGFDNGCSISDSFTN